MIIAILTLMISISYATCFRFFAIFFPLPVIYEKVLITDNFSSFIFSRLLKFSLSYDNCLNFRIDDSGEPRVHTFTLRRVR